MTENNEWKNRVEEIVIRDEYDAEDEILNKGEKFWKSMLEKSETHDKDYVKTVGLVTDNEPNRTIRQYQWQVLGRQLGVKAANLIFKLSMIPAAVQIIGMLIEGNVIIPF